ncbi:MAG: AraC family transcriptional regulator [Labilithrix sp.]|nr:AraC family transcriptional regulator [Labilithrix sp.]
MADASRELASAIARHVPHDGERSPFPFVHLSRTSRPTRPMPVLYEPAFVVLAQGKKLVTLGDDELTYDRSSYFLSSVALPITGRVVKASAAAPYLGVRLALPPSLVGSVLANEMLPREERTKPERGLDVRPLDHSLLDAVLRLVRLADAPEHAPMLAPLVLQEIVYRLFVDGHAARLQHIATVGGRPHGVTAAIAWIRTNFDQAMRIEQLAKAVGMSPSGLHLHFRAVTGMSPLQYQKTLRLNEARRLMLSERIDSSTAGFRVGYNDPSQFTREYRRQFGAPPLRDVSRLRA